MAETGRWERVVDDRVLDGKERYGREMVERDGRDKQTDCNRMLSTASTSCVCPEICVNTNTKLGLIHHVGFNLYCGRIFPVTNLISLQILFCETCS